jgi:hypothetical protein
MFFRNIIHKLLLTGIPSILYNPFTAILNAPFNVAPYSTYVNIKLTSTQVDYLNVFLKTFSLENTPPLHLVPIRLTKQDLLPAYYISVNIYNCSSPIFLNGGQPVTRCEINTYVKNIDNVDGTVILDYCSNGISIDPVNILKMPQFIRFFKENGDGRGGGENDRRRAVCSAKNDNVEFHMKYDLSTISKYSIADSLISYTDKIYYPNGIYDKLYYDSSLVNADTAIPESFRDFFFRFKEIEFCEKDIHSVFYFKNDIRFICQIWDNL